MREARATDSTVGSSSMMCASTSEGSCSSRDSSWFSPATGRGPSLRARFVAGGPSTDVKMDETGESRSVDWLDEYWPDMVSCDDEPAAAAAAAAAERVSMIERVARLQESALARLRISGVSRRLGWQFESSQVKSSQVRGWPRYISSAVRQYKQYRSGTQHDLTYLA